ncbi:MAG TPA: TonB-dependent receptor [Candidatus Acidoferrales bacterium]|nr:TonB-dependent receptor [Candidatus Acidoferrales bacterium]
MKSVRSSLQLLLVGLGVVLLCLPVFSQAYSGTISGSVTDQSGGAIAGATVTITDVDRGVARTLTTDSTGAYSAPNLTPGKYSVRAEFKGFKVAERTNLTLEVAQSLRADMSLQPGEQTQTVTVTEQAPVVNVTDSTLGGTLQPGTIQDLPLNGRNFMNLLALRPGVTIYPGGGAWTQSTNGMRPEQNFYMLDGVSGFEPFSAQSTFNSVSLSGDTATLLPLDAIQEFNVEENPKAEYGWKPGAIVNIALRSGTNAFHGSGDAFGRTDALDATNPFVDPTLPRQTVDVINFGADIGGPIKKDKAFFFVGYAGQRYSLGNPSQLKWPTLNPGATVAQGGVIAACNAVRTAGGAPLSLTSLTVAGLNPDCTRSTGPTVFQNVSATSSYLQDLNTTIRSDNGLAKVDWHLTDKHSLTLRMFIGNSSGPQVNSPSIQQPQWRPNPFSRDYTLGANETWIASSNVVNEVRFGLSRFTQAFINGDCDSPLNPTLNQGTGICGFTNISISGFSGSTGCCSSFPKYQGPDSTPEVIDHVSVNHGNHAFKFGVELRDDIYNGGTFSNSRGVTAFTPNSSAQCPDGSLGGYANSLEDFMAGCLNSSTIFVGSPLRHISQWAFAGFGQDDWRITPKLTLNLGLRYEYVTPLKESDNRLANFDPNVGLFQVGSIANINLRSNPYLPDKNNFAPRVGFAWDVMGNGKWVVRGGAGISYVLEGFNIFVSQQSSVNPTSGLNTNPTGLPVCTSPGAAPGDPSCTPGPGNIVSTAFNIGSAASAPSGFGNNWNQNPAFNGGTIFPGSNTSKLVCQPTAPCNITSVQQNMVTPYVTFWSLGVEHAFTNNLSLDLGYVGNHGTKLLGIIDQNNPVLGSGYCMNITAAQAASANALKPGSCPSGVATPASIVAGGVFPKVSSSAEQASRPFFSKFPYYGYIYSIGNYFESNYDGLQATLTQRVTHGLSATIGYTYSHALDDASNDWSGTGQIPQNPFDTGAEYSNSTFDITHRFTATITYALPGRSGFGQMLEGWKVTSIVTLESALPWGVQNSKSSGADPSGTGEFQDRWNFVGSYKPFNGLGANSVPYLVGAQAVGNAACVAAAGGPGTLGYLSLQQYGCFQMGNSVMTPPAIGSYGDMTRNTFRGNGIHLWDASVMKDWRFKENLTGEFRFEVFNLLNHTQYGNPEFNGAGSNLPFDDPSLLGSSTQTPDVANSNPSIGSGAARTIQLGFVLKF